MPSKDNWLESVPIAHRGLHTETFPENSIGAFSNAKKYGYAIEIDVQLSANNCIVVFHDEDMFRMTGEKGRIKDLDLSQIKKRKLLNSDFTIPTLEDVFHEINSEVPILIEIKNYSKIGVLEKTLCSEINKYQGQCAVESFNPFSLKIIKEICPSILRGQLSQKFTNENLNFIKRIVLKNFWLNKISQPHFIAYNIDDLPDARVDSFRNNGIFIIGWTITDEINYLKSLKYCDNIIFENGIIDYFQKD